MLWSFVFCFLIMSVWAMFMVEVVHPLINDPDSPVEFMQEPHGLSVAPKSVESNGFAYT